MTAPDFIADTVRSLALQIDKARGQFPAGTVIAEVMARVVEDDGGWRVVVTLEPVWPWREDITPTTGGPVDLGLPDGCRCHIREDIDYGDVLIRPPGGCPAHPRGLDLATPYGRDFVDAAMALFSEPGVHVVDRADLPECVDGQWRCGRCKGPMTGTGRCLTCWPGTARATP